MYILQFIINTIDLSERNILKITELIIFIISVQPPPGEDEEE